ncbi:DUF192 domain-containing protein [Rhizobium lemnae]|uniref:DUF192 domain-containing protein n=1 Tax=Rhizobium lemnae TaxID=1214924 RepID=A0ABV8E573_9HYPH|nr:DUF192 domain-containing protein [Rhizobium lemnae]MCJ8510201.1 DUF192 domain-containing protein [Rhizobium lemnae]
MFMPIVKFMSALLALFLCSVSPSSAQLKFPTEQLIIQTATGPQVFTVEVAVDGPQRQQGLMFREKMAADAGMLFDFGSPREVAMWMKNTLIPLDMLFIDEKGIVRKIHEGAKPHDETPLSSGGPVKYVLELNGGAVEARNIAVGNKVVSPQIGNAR